VTPGTIRVVGALAVVASVCAAAVSDPLDPPTQGRLYENLQTASAVLFGVIGAWIALIYPKAVGTAGADQRSAAAVYRSLQPAMVLATIVLATMIIGMPAAEVIIRSEFFGEHRDLLLRGSFGVLALLSLLEIWALLVSLVPVVSTQRSVSLQERKVRVQTQRRGLATTANEESPRDPQRPPDPSEPSGGTSGLAEAGGAQDGSPDP